MFCRDAALKDAAVTCKMSPRFGILLPSKVVVVVVVVVVVISL